MYDRALFSYKDLPVVTCPQVLCVKGLVPEDLVNSLEHVIKHDSSGVWAAYTLQNVFKIANHYDLDPYAQQRIITRYVLGSWECEKSPYGHCIYDHHVDPAHDICLVCELPEERK